jgi:ketosteroid isomerase-like protein
MRGWGWGIGLFFTLAVAAPGWAIAQVQHSRMPTTEQVRSEYLAEVGKGVTEAIARLREAVEANDVAGLTRLFVDGALYSPSSGDSHYGAAAIREAFAARLLAVGPVLLTRVDFSASGNLAYQFGRYVYGAGPDGEGREEGTYVLILVQEGRAWKIRSLVERRATS